MTPQILGNPQMEVISEEEFGSILDKMLAQASDACLGV